MNRTPCRNTQYMQNICRQPGVSCQYKTQNVQTSQCGNPIRFTESVQVNVQPRVYPSGSPQCQKVGKKRR